MDYNRLVLISHQLCPYVQRSVITLTEKQIPHQRRYIDLGNKPEWFRVLSPLGKVPLLQVDNHDVVFESAVICEFLDEITPGSLHPGSALEKARHRSWIEFGSQLLNDIARLYNAPTADAFDAAARTIRAKLQRLEPEVEGPFFAGDRFSLVDAAYGPLFRYFDVLDPYLPTPVFRDCPGVSAWRRELARRTSIRNAVSRDYPELLKAFLLRRDSYLSQWITRTDESLAIS